MRRFDREKIGTIVMNVSAVLAAVATLAGFIALLVARSW